MSNEMISMSGITVGDFIEVDSDRGFADNGPWSSSVIEVVGDGGFKVSYDDGNKIYYPKQENLSAVLTRHVNRCWYFSK